MVLPILRWPDPILAARCTEVDVHDASLGGLAGAMLDTMYDAPGRGLAAPQVGRTLRLFVMDVDWKDGARRPWVFLNPEIVARSDSLATREEGCLSLPGLQVAVARPDAVTLRWTGLDGRGHERAFDGMAATCIQHEMDHLDGIVTLDHLDAEARARAEAAYFG